MCTCVCYWAFVFPVINECWCSAINKHSIACSPQGSHFALYGQSDVKRMKQENKQVRKKMHWTFERELRSVMVSHLHFSQEKRLIWSWFTNKWGVNDLQVACEKMIMCMGNVMKNNYEFNAPDQVNNKTLWQTRTTPSISGALGKFFTGCPLSKGHGMVFAVWINIVLSCYHLVRLGGWERVRRFSTDQTVDSFHTDFDYDFRIK